MFKGRKVTDPVVHGAAAGAKESRPGISKAWDSVGRAKSELRKIEQRLGDVERHPLPGQLNQTGETSITDYGGLGHDGDNDRTFDVSDNQEFASGAVVDNYGRSAYLKSKGTTRKVSRLDGKYTEDNEEEERKLTTTTKKTTTTSRKKEPRASETNKHKQTNFHLREKNYNAAPAKMAHTKKANEKHVEFSNIVHSRENHMDLTYGIPPRDQNHISEDSTLTNSRDIRETEINFLNNNLTLPERETDVRWNQAGTKFTHVDVTVPGTATTMSSNKYSSAEPSHKQHFLDLVTENHTAGDGEGRAVGSDDSLSDSETSRGRRFRGNIRNIDPAPVKKQRKLYVDNEELAVPLRTLFRWKRVKDAAENSEQNQLLHNTNFASQGPESLEGAVDTTCTSQATSDTSSFRHMDCESVVDVPFDLSSGCPSESSDVGSLNSEYMSDVSNTEESTDTSSASDSTSDTDSTSDVESEYSSSSDTANPNSEDNTNLLSNELEALRIVSCFRRHNLTTSACRDITATVRSVCNDSKSAHVLNYDYLMSFVDTNLLREVHYCELCSEVFPDDPDRTRCGSANCEGLRYKGPISKQNSKDRQSRKCFIIADMKKQLSDLLQSPGVMADIRTQKDAARSRKDDDTDSITDISDGAAYRKMLKDDGFLNNADYNITAVINTDGVNLYSSSKVELWPIFMAINELNPKARFSRSNVLLVGIWQGKGKPPFKQYVESLAPHLNDLYRGGVNIALNGDNINVKLKVVCGIFDLPAKAGILNMTYYNGQEACITCEEPGVTVKQGKGTARSYPDRNGQYTLRNHEDVLNCMQSGTDKKRVKGFKGVSGLASIESFDLVDGIMPDYMHGVLLGITSTLMSKWFSPTGSNKAYFIGKHLKEISRRLQNIRPPTSIERLPRDLEKNYKNLKATELQAWLLFYAVPCLVGILPEMYLAHFSCFSEAVYILLGDQITLTNLQRAEHLLDQFYTSFAELYGAGSCGLNVHNTCVHLVHYVKLWGPLWAWSCFGFEDNNAMLLQAVHGTGVVTKQIMWYKQVEATLRRKSVTESRSRIWKTTCKAENCDVSGKMTMFENDGTEGVVLVKLGIDSGNNLRQIARITVNAHQFCSLRYTRMKKRACSYVLYEDSKVGCVKYFVTIANSGIVHAVLEKYDVCEEIQISELPAGKHLVPVKANGSIDVIPADNLIDTLVYIKVCPEIGACVALMPSTHGHAIFK